MIVELLWTWEMLTEVKRFAYFIIAIITGNSNSYSVIYVVEDAESVVAVLGSDIVA